MVDFDRGHLIHIWIHIYWGPCTGGGLHDRSLLISRLGRGSDLGYIQIGSPSIDH